jgi:hypothetical protein
MRKSRCPYFSQLNDPIPDGEKPAWVSLATGKPIETDATRIPRGFNRWARGKPTTRGSVMMLFCTIGQYRFKAKMEFLAQKCDLTVRGLRNVLRDLESGNWVLRKETKRGGSLSGWNMFTLPHLSGIRKPPDYRRKGRSSIDSPKGR